LWFELHFGVSLGGIAEGGNGKGNLYNPWGLNDEVNEQLLRLQ
jgi:hypothetical protein